MERLKRTVTCGALRKGDEGRRVTLNGWVHRHRDHGGIRFIDMRDRYGVTQVVIDSDAPAALREAGAELKFEYCIAVEGTVRARPPAMANPHMPTGEIEVKAESLAILSRSEVLPFMVDEKADAREDLRFKYRYLDLRTFSMQRKIAGLLRDRHPDVYQEHPGGRPGLPRSVPHQRG
jgi:aspartyl-tRNA synthetase